MNFIVLAPQLLVGADLIPVLHKLEQVSSDEHIGTLAENLMEALRESSATVAKIEDVRQQTKAEKKKLAMAMRQKQLGALGMTVSLLYCTHLSYLSTFENFPGVESAQQLVSDILPIARGRYK